jgi:hypothetical protein
MRRSATLFFVIGALIGLSVPVVCLWTTFSSTPDAWDWIIYMWPNGL